MVERTQLGRTILRHWRENCPDMVKELEKNNRLAQALNEAQERTGDLLHELVSVQKLDYQAAWEIATQEWAFRPSEDRPPQPSSTNSKTSPKRHPHETSG